MAENAAREQGPRGKPFRKGVSGNPTGKPKGTRNRATMLAEQLLDGEAEAIVRTVLEIALRLCLDRILPPRRDRPMRLTIPELNSGADAVKALAAITTAVARGELTPSEAAELSGLIEVYVKTIATSEIEQRLKVLEERQFTGLRE
jgi:Family of unknown function (DUF5681)